MASMFNGAAAFNQNLAGWNVLRVNTAGFGNTWTGTAALSACNAGAIYTAWGTTFQTAWPTLNYLCTVGSVTCAMCITNGNIGAAVMAWLTNSTAAATTYGDIVEWNTAAVSDMASLFYPSSYARPTFNSDISKWNVASVSTMASTFSGASALNQNLASWNVLRVNAAGFATMWGNFPPTLPQAHTHSRL